MRLGAALLVAFLAPRVASAASPEVTTGLENLYFLTSETSLDRANVLGLDPNIDFLRVTLSVKETQGVVRGVARGFVEQRFGVPDDDAKVTVREAYLQVQGVAASLRVGKQRLAWGSGFAWNPTNRLEPPKNALDTSLEQPGVVGARGEWSPTAATSITLVAARVETRSDDLPIDLPKDTRDGAAARFGLLIANIDVAAVVSAEKGRRPLVGLDLSRALSGHVSAHAEGALYRGSELPAPNPLVTTGQDTLVRVVAGLLYTAGEQSIALEYFHNGEGYGDDERHAWLTSLARAFAASNDARLAESARRTARTAYVAGTAAAYQGLGLGRDYLHASWSQRRPGGSWELSFHVVASLTDGGVALTPAVAYTAGGHVTLQANGLLLRGGSDSEYGVLPVRGGIVTRVKVQF